MKQVKHTPLVASLVLSATVVSAPAMAHTSGQSGQVARSTPAQELTRSLNSRPPQAVPAASPATTPPSATPVAPQSGARGGGNATQGTASAAPARPAATAQTTTAAGNRSQQGGAAPTPAPAPSNAPARGTAPTAPASPAAATAEAAPPAPPRPVPLNAAAIAALPFRIDLRGAQIVERPAGARAKIYSVSRSERPLLMIYTGPQSDYPIYDGEQATVAGRVSIVLNQAGTRRAVEHLFRREDKQPADVHVWLMATDGADGALAEQIGQSVDPR